MTIYLLKKFNNKVVDCASFEGQSKIDKFYLKEYEKHGYIRVKLSEYIQYTDPSKMYGDDYYNLSWRQQNERMKEVMKNADCLRFMGPVINQAYWDQVAKEKAEKKASKVR